jgi:aquaporin Z
VASYIVLEAPLSGMSLNPARTLGSAVHAREWTALWVYLAAPLLGMLAAARLYVATHGGHRVLCAKLHHDNAQRCIFRCGYGRRPPGAR